MQLRRHKSAPRLACALALCLAIATGPATASPVDGETPASETQDVRVEVTQPTPSVTTGGRLRASVQVSLAAPAEYVEVRLRLRQPTGRIVYQKTEVRANLQPGQHTIDYEHELASLDLKQGRYPLEIRVLATGSPATNLTSRLLVTQPGESLPVAVVVVASAIPAVATDGRFMIDPADDTQLRDNLSFITELARERRVPLALAVPPVLIEQLGRASAGYETTAGVVATADDDAALRTARLLDALQSAIATGTVDLVDVPYALPNLGILKALDAEADLALQWTRSDEVNASVLHSAASPKVAYVGPVLTDQALAMAEERGLSCVLAPPSAVSSGEETTAPGCYELRGGGPKVLVVHEDAAEGVREGAEAFYDAMFDQLGNGPAVVMLQLGPEPGTSAVDVQHALDWIDDATWLRLGSLETVARDEDGEPVRLRSAQEDARSEYWSEVDKGREATLAYSSAAGPDDADALAIQRAMLISESSLFSSEAGGSEASYDGRTFARDARDFVTRQFSLIRLDTKDVTLSGTKGDVPLTLINDTGKSLTLTLHARSSTVLPDSPKQEIVIQPTQNFLTVPIDLGNTLSDTLVVEVLAGDLKVTETVVKVKASYIDRLAIIGMVVLVLGGLLMFIRRRVLSSDAGTIDSGRQGQDPDAGWE